MPLYMKQRKVTMRQMQTKAKNQVVRGQLRYHTTENIGDLRRNLEATDLRHITTSARQDEPVDSTEGEELGSHNAKGTKRNKRSSKKKTKQRQREARRQRTYKKNSKCRQRKRNPSPDEGHNSSSLSSNSSSSSSVSSSAYTTSSDDKAFWHLDHTRSQT
jgi:hypothetical protein